MQTIKIFFGILITTYMLTSCSPVYYAPNSHNVPLMEKKGDISVNVTGGTSLNGIQLQGSLAATDHVGIILNGMTVSDKYKEGSTIINRGGGSMIELGVGYFKPLSDHFILESFAMYGKGSFENKFRDSGKLTGDISKYAWQTNIGYKRKFFELTYSLKPTIIDYSNLEGNLVKNEVDQRALLENKSRYKFVEGSTTLRFGFEQFKLQLQTVGNVFGDNEKYLGDDATLSLGIRINVNAFSESNH